MLRISLINMPFSAIEMPSIALTQLQSVVAGRFPGQTEVEIHYLSNDIARYLGYEDYRGVCDEHSGSGLGDWLFRQAAFPDLPDNTPVYQQRYFQARGPKHDLFERLLEKRAGLDRLLDQLIEKYRLGEADLVGFTSMFAQSAASFALARKLKERKPGLIVTMGGANCESPMGEEIAKNVEAVDYVFSGPALLSFPLLVEGVLQGDLSRIEGVNGVFTKANQSPASVLGDELDINVEVPLDYKPYLHELETSFPDLPVDPFVLFETSRGCWWGARAHCTFCGLNGGTMSYRPMDADKAIRLMRGLFEDYPGVRNFSCVDNIMPKSYPREVFTQVQAPPGASIFYEIKADLTEEELGLLSQAGVDIVQPGIEALSTSTLKLMRKGTTSVRNVQFLKHCLAQDVHPAWNLLVGFPGEGQEVYKQYVEEMPKLVHLPPPSGAHLVRFDRFSPYFTQAAQYGLDLQPLDFYELTYPFGRESLSNLAYYFADRNVMATYFMDVARWINKMRQALAPWRAAWESGAAPSLHFTREGGTTIRDTRSGYPVTHEVGEIGKRILAALADPGSQAELAARFAAGPQVSPEILDAELARLREKGLLFEDGQRLVSLVLPHEPKPERLRRRYLRAAAVPA